MGDFSLSPTVPFIRYTPRRSLTLVSPLLRPGGWSTQLFASKLTVPCGAHLDNVGKSSSHRAHTHWHVRHADIVYPSMSYSHSLVSLPAIWSALISSRSYLARALYFDWTTEYSYTTSRVKTSATLRQSCTSLHALAGTTISESILRDCSSVTRALSGSARHIRLVQVMTLCHTPTRRELKAT